MDLEPWERRFEELLRRDPDDDPAHGLDHVRRVVANARRIGRLEGAESAVVVPAAWLHDCVRLEKDAAERASASTRAAERARRILAEWSYPRRHLDPIAHCIEAHSFSAGIEPRTLEAKVVQDADRLDALGAVGLARCWMTGGRLRRPLYDPEDPFCRDRPPDDGRSTLDHFFSKLLALPATMQTGAGRREAERRGRFLERYLEELASELPGTG